MIKKLLEEIHKRISDAAKRSGREPGEVFLLGVTKGIDIKRIEEAIDAGLKTFGESRVQEALPKIKTLGKSASWHFIGHLQKNKVKYIVGEVELIHSVDSIILSEEIDKRSKKRGVVQKILIEVNVSGEKDKFGFPPEEVIRSVEEIRHLENISLCGLMTIPPYSEDPEDSRPYFQKLRELRLEVIETFPDLYEFKELSMGMSNDFEVAIEEGSTIVRIGTAIFGERSY